MTPTSYPIGYPMGAKVAFIDHGKQVYGYVNGDPVTDEDGGVTHVPVYLKDGDSVIYVAVRNMREVST